MIWEKRVLASTPSHSLILEAIITPVKKHKDIKYMFWSEVINKFGNVVKITVIHWKIGETVSILGIIKRFNRYVVYRKS